MESTFLEAINLHTTHVPKCFPVCDFLPQNRSRGETGLILVILCCSITYRFWLWMWAFEIILCLFQVEPKKLDTREDYMYIHI